MTRDQLIEQLLEVLDDEAAAASTQASAPAQTPVIARYMTADHQAARSLNEMKDMLRTTADLLEMEAAHLRQELERLESQTTAVVRH